MERTSITTPIDQSIVRGVAELEVTEQGVLPHRLPAWARAQNSDPQVAMVEAQPAGVRLAFRTSATVVELDVLRTKLAYAGAPPRPDGLYDLLVDGEPAGQQPGVAGNTYALDMTTGRTEFIPGPVGTVRFTDLPAREKDVEIWLPHTESTLLVALRSDAPIDPSPAPDRPLWLHHGSSISHGSMAENPTGTWPVVAALRAGVELRSLGFGGSMMLDPFTARTIRDAPADLISLKIGINVVNLDAMRRRVFGPAVHGFLDTIREGHPTTPLLVVSPILCPTHEQTPGPCLPDTSSGTMMFRAVGDPAEVAQGKLTLEVIRDELARIVAQRSVDDPHLAYLDGRELYGDADVEGFPLPDGLHPDGATHRLMGERFARLAFGERGSLAPA